MEEQIKKKPNTWSITVTRACTANRKKLRSRKYQRIATGGKMGRRSDVHLKIGSEARTDTKEVLTRLEALQKWGAESFNEINCDAFTKTTAKEPWDQVETTQMRRTMIIEAMGWMTSPTADRGVKTEAQVTHMVKKGLTRRSAEKIVSRTTQQMFDEYAKDARKKRDYCKKKLDQLERERQKERKTELAKERQNRKEMKEAEKEKKKEDKRRQAQEKKQLRQKEKEKEAEEKRLQREEKAKLRQKEKERKAEENRLQREKRQIKSRMVMMN